MKLQVGGANNDRYFSNSLAARDLTIRYDRYGAYANLSHTEYRYTSGSYKRCLRVYAYRNGVGPVLSGITTSLNNANARNPSDSYTLYFANNSSYTSLSSAASHATSTLNINIYIVYRQRYHITLDPNGGDGTRGFYFYAGLGGSYSHTPTRAGYTLKGWSTDPNANPAQSYPTTITISDSEANSDKRYYAIWERNTYNVDINILNPNGVQDFNSGTMTQSYGSQVHTGTDQGFDDIYYGDSWLISNITPAPGMVLESVYLQKNRGYLYQNSDGSYGFQMTYGGNVNPDGDAWDDAIIIKMRYKNYAIQYLYGYDQNGNGNGNDDVCGTGAVTYASSTNLLAEQERVGYLFNKWHRIGSEEYYEAGVSYSPGDFTDGSTIQFEATWISKEYNVYYNNGYGGADESVGKIYYSNGTYTLRGTPIRDGYTFTGWLCSADNKVYGGGATYTIPNIDNNSNIKFTAQWTENEYIIVYNANNGSGQTLEARIKYTREYTIIENRFTTVNKFFKGWATEANGAVVYLPGATVLKLTAVNGERINLYAVWEETWASSAVTAPSGTGSQSDPYIIASAENLAWIASQNDTFNGKFFKQITNIDLDGKVWMPIGTQAEFMGIYDGLSFEIKNVIVPSYLSFGANTYANIGLFGRTNGATISRIHLINAEFNGLNNVGAIVGQVSSMTVVENCILEDCQVYSNNGLGMIIGNNAGTIENCLVLNMRTTNNNLSLGGQSQTSCLYEINIDGALTRYTTDLNSFVYENWGIVGNDLLPCDSSWMASVNIATRESVEAWRDKTL